MDNQINGWNSVLVGKGGGLNGTLVVCGVLSLPEDIHHMQEMGLIK